MMKQLWIHLKQVTLPLRLGEEKRDGSIGPSVKQRSRETGSGFPTDLLFRHRLTIRAV